MKFITAKQYWEYERNQKIERLEEERQEYKLPKTKEKIYYQEKIKEIDKQHDKMFRNILGRKKETVKFLNQFLQLKEEIEEDNIMACPTDFITKNYQDRHSDIIYRLKDKPVYFLIEHQSTVDPDMPLRIWEYIGEIIRKEKFMINHTFSKEVIYPIVVPIVIYTGYQKWSTKINFAQKQYQSTKYSHYQIQLEYNLIAVQDYIFEELLEKRSLFSSIMIIEKCKTKEEFVEYVNKIVQTTENQEELKVLSEIINKIVISWIGEKETNKILGRIKGGDLYESIN